MKKSILLSLVMIVSVILIFSVIKLNQSPIQKQTRFLMSTYCSIQIPGKKNVLPFIDSGFLKIEEIDKRFNILDSKSPLYTFNRKASPLYDQEIVDLIERALSICKESNGLFDITVMPLVELWGFYTETYTVPQHGDILKTLPSVDYSTLTVQNDSLIKKDSSVTIDLGGIAKGYALEKAANELTQRGVTSALIDAGGDIYALGTYRDRPWQIGIRHPRKEGFLGVLSLSDYAVVTSGDYERYFEKNGTRYHHIINPKTGYPTKEMMSVTVICKDPVAADAWSTALFAMKPEKALHLVENKPELEALLITAAGKVLCSSGMMNSMELNNGDSVDET